MVRTLFFLPAVLVPALGGCGNLYNVSDPVHGVSLPDYLKSVRCEAVTFLEVNRKTRGQFADIFNGDPFRAMRDYRFMILEDDLYAGVYVQFKDTNTYSGSLGLDRRTGGTPVSNHTWHFGPTSSAPLLQKTGTYTFDQPFVIPQNAEIFTKDLAGRSSSDYFCYRYVGPEPSLEQLDRMSNGTSGLEQFRRIYVDGKTTLSEWLRAKAREATKGYFSPYYVKEFMAPGQLNYTFTIDVKPTVDVRYSLVADAINPMVAAINPLVADASASFDHLGTVNIIFNTPYAIAAANAKQGNVAQIRPEIPSTAPPGPSAEDLQKSILAASNRQIALLEQIYTKIGGGAAPQSTLGARSTPSPSGVPSKSSSHKRRVLPRNLTQYELLDRRNHPNLEFLAPTATPSLAPTPQQ